MEAPKWGASGSSLWGLSTLLSGARGRAPNHRRPPVATAAVTEDPNLDQPRVEAHGRPSSAARSPPCTVWTVSKGLRGATMCDAQAGVPSAGWLRAQLAFKDSMVHGILQFTPGTAFRYVLHRCESRDIRCRESFLDLDETRHLLLRQAPDLGPQQKLVSLCFLDAFRAGVGWWPRTRGKATRSRRGGGSRRVAPLAPQT